MVLTRPEVRALLRRVLAAEFACSPDDLANDRLTVTMPEQRLGRRRFPFRPGGVAITTMGSGIVANAPPERVEWLREILDRARGDVFSAATIAQLEGFARAEGLRVAGPHLGFALTAQDLYGALPPDGVEVDVVGGGQIDPLRTLDGFQHALARRHRPERPDVLAVVATEQGQVVGLAGASADADELWQIGVDVLAPTRGRGIGRAIVARLAGEILARGVVPYYSTTVGNLASRGLAVSVGFWPAWVQLYTVEAEPLAEYERRAALVPTLTDGVIVLGGYVLEDAEVQANGEDEEFARRFGWYPNRSTPETVRRHILRVTREWETGGATRAFAARDAATGALVGGAELRLQADGLAHISWWTLAPFRRGGYATRAARLACAYAFDHLDVERIEAYVEVDNVGSRGVARAAGFQEEGILRRHGRVCGERRDFVLYALLREERR